MARSLNFEEDQVARNGRQADPQPLAKKAKTAHFDSDDEAEQAAANAKLGNRRSGATGGHAQKLARKAEADRLLEGRRRLPVYEGECLRSETCAVEPCRLL